MRRQLQHTGGLVALEATLSGWQTYTFTHTGTCDIYRSGSYVGSTTSTVAYPINVTKGQRVDIVFSNPESVTSINMSGARLLGDFGQFSQFANLASLTPPNMDPVAHITDTELLTNASFPADLTGWTADAQWAITGSRFVCTGNGINQVLAQDVTLTRGNVYEVEVAISQSSLTGLNAITLGNTSSFGFYRLSTAVGISKYMLFAVNAPVSGQFKIFLESGVTGGTITIDWLSVKAVTNQVLTGGFDADENWAKGDAAVTIGSGVATWSGAQAGAATLTQDVSALIADGTQVKTVYTLTRSAGIMTPNLMGTALAAKAAAGTYSAYLSAGTDNDNLVFSGDADLTGTLDAVRIHAWPAQNIGGYASLSKSLTTLNINGASNLAWTTGALNAHVLLTSITIDAANLTVDEINSFFASLVINEAAGSAARDCTVTLTNVPRPTGQGLTDATTVLVTAKGWTVTIPAT
jgi:hypothetical protein